MSYSIERTKKITVTPIYRDGGWLKKGHDGNHLFTGAHNTYITPLLEKGGGRLVNPLEGLTVQELESLAKEIGVEVKELNVDKKDDNFFHRERVLLEKGVRVLDLSKPYDYIHYRILKINKSEIAPSDKDKYEKPTYRWALVDNEEVVQEQAKSTTVKMDAVMKLAEYKGSVDKLTNLLTVAGMVIPTNVTSDWLFTEAYKLADTNPRKFLALATDEDFDVKLMINKGLDKKVLIKISKNEYGFDGGKSLGTKEDMIAHFSNINNSKDTAFLKAKLND